MEAATMPAEPMTAPVVETVDPRALLRRLDDERAEMVELLSLLAHGPLALAADELERLGFEVREVGGSATGSHLYARPRSRRAGAPVQLVVAPGAPGLVTLLFALRAIAELGVAPAVTPVVLANSDADIGSPDSSRLLRRLAGMSVRALVLEPAEDGVVAAREAVGCFTVTLRASEGAALELAERLRRVTALHDPVGGIVVDVVEHRSSASAATAVTVVRAGTVDAAARVSAAIEALAEVSQARVVEVAGGFPRPPMEPLARNRALVGAAVRLGVSLGIRVAEHRGAAGATDANTTSASTATLAGLGPGADPQSLVERSALLALLLLEPSGAPPRRAAARRRPHGRIAVVGSAANESNLDLVAAWQGLGLPAELLAPDAVHPDDVVLGRLDITSTLDGIEPGLFDLLRFERSGMRVLNRAFAIVRAHDKLLTARSLVRAGVPHPRTTQVRADRPLPLVTLPLVVKPRFGSWGADVFRCETPAELQACLEAVRTRPWFRRHGALVQELVPPCGRDVRLLVAGGRAVGAIERLAVPGEWRTNISLGGSYRSIEPPPEAARHAVAAAAAIGADLVGVDLLPCDGGYTVLELNGAVEFDRAYSLVGRNVFRDAAAALTLGVLRQA